MNNANRANKVELLIQSQVAFICFVITASSRRTAGRMRRIKDGVAVRQRFALMTSNCGIPVEPTVRAGVVDRLILAERCRSDLNVLQLVLSPGRLAADLEISRERIVWAGACQTKFIYFLDRLSETFHTCQIVQLIHRL